MDLNNPQNQSYWFVVREDQSNVIFSTNNVIHNPHIAGQETRYIVDTGDNQQYIHVNRAAVAEPVETTPTMDTDNFWDRNKVQLLLSLWRDHRFKDNTNKDKTMWDQVAAIVGISEEECIKKYKSLRRTYARLLKKRRYDENVKWIHYKLCEEVFKDCRTLSTSTLVPWEDKKVRKLLTLYIENLHRFRNKDCIQRDVWKEIALTLNITEYNCYQKFKNLKRRYFVWLEKKRNTGRQIKWPYLQYFERIFYDYEPYVCSWDSTKTKQLIDAYSQIAYKFRSPSFRKKELWKEIAAIVGKKASDCDRKFRNLKQTYVRLRMRADTGRTITKWKYYKDFEALYNNMKISRNGVPINSRFQDVDYVIQLLKFVLDNIEKFKYSMRKRRLFWRLIGPKLGLTAEECDRKFRNLKQTYIRLREQKMQTGKCNKWPYYCYFEKIYENYPERPKKMADEANRELDSQTVAEIRKVMREMQERHSGDKFDKLIQAVQDSNDIQRERNMILKAMLDRR